MATPSLESPDFAETFNRISIALARRNFLLNLISPPEITTITNTSTSTSSTSTFNSTAQPKEQQQQQQQQQQDLLPKSDRATNIAGIGYDPSNPSCYSTTTTNYNNSNLKKDDLASRIALNAHTSKAATETLRRQLLGGKQYSQYKQQQQQQQQQQRGVANRQYGAGRGGGGAGTGIGAGTGLMKNGRRARDADGEESSEDEELGRSARGRAKKIRKVDEVPAAVEDGMNPARRDLLAAQQGQTPSDPRSEELSLSTPATQDTLLNGTSGQMHDVVSKPANLPSTIKDQSMDDITTDATLATKKKRKRVKKRNRPAEDTSGPSTAEVSIPS